MKERVVYCPVGNEFSPCDPAEVQPIVAHLRRNQPVPEQLIFTRGSHLPDGRVDLCKQCVGPEGTKLVAAAVGSNEHTRHLLMGANGMGNTGANAIAETIRKSKTLQTVYLGCNLIDAAGATELAQAISDSPSVRALWLKRNPIGFAGAEQIAAMLKRNPQIRTLDLVHTKIGSQGVQLIVRTLTTEKSAVELLYLGGNEIESKDAEVLSELLKQNQTIRGLYLSVNRLGDEGASKLAAGLRWNQGLKVLNLSSNRIGPAGAAALATALKSHPGLVNLDLGFDRSTTVLGEQPNFLGDEGANAIASLILNNSRIRSLNLLHNEITDRGARSLIDALEQNEALIQLKIGKGIRQYYRRRLRELLSRNQKHQVELPATAEDILAIRSIYRTLKK